MQAPRILATLAIPFAALLLLGCGDDSTGPGEPGEDDWLPLAVGNSWNYSTEGLMVSEGDSTDIEGVFEREITCKVSHQQGFDVWELESMLEMTFHPREGSSYTVTDTSYSYVYLDDTELRLYEDTITTEYQLMLMLPLEVGDTWYPFPDDTTVVREVMSISASVTVPAGSFTGCSHVRDTDSTAPESESAIYFARGVGSLREVTDDIDEQNSLYIESVLVSYTVN